MKKQLTFLAVSLLFTANANAYEIKFEDGGYANNWDEISSSYGSISGLLNVSYSDPQRGVSNFRFWLDSYSDHPAAFASDNDSTGAGYITLTPMAGYQVKLNSFFLGSYQNADRNSSYSIDDLATAGVDVDSGSWTIGAAGLTVASNLTSGQGIKIGFGPSAYNVGINYINFEVTPVPEPETYAMLLAGLGLVGLIKRRQSKTTI